MNQGANVNFIETDLATLTMFNYLDVLITSCVLSTCPYASQETCPVAQLVHENAMITIAVKYTATTVKVKFFTLLGFVQGYYTLLINY